MKEQDKERLRTLVVELLLTVRRQYARTSGFNPIKQWEILSNRMRAAARTSENADVWSTNLLRGLQVEAPDKDSSACLIELTAWVREHRATDAMLDLIEKEHALLVAMARSLLDKRREQAAGTGDTTAEVTEQAASDAAGEAVA